ncbi:MAG: methyltransferase domain-containing protein [bacterium]
MPEKREPIMLHRVNIGCGTTPTPGWLNYDNSMSVRLAGHPLATAVLKRLGILGGEQEKFIAFAKKGGIACADATRRIPLPDNSVEVLYASHVLEHLYREKANRLLREAYRVLAPDGIIRIAVPDLRKMAEKYIAEGDADAFVEKTLLAQDRPGTLSERLKRLVVGERRHLWMYDGASVRSALSAAGFREPEVLEPGSTGIQDPGELNLHERADESVYVESRK